MISYERIGVDLDNTLINYDDSFSAAADYLSVKLPTGVKTKNQISQFLKSTKEGEHFWQRLQGLAYGRFLKSHAKLYPGVKRFLLHCHYRGNPVTIVSHKTKHGHFDSEQIMLRDVVLEFLVSKGLIDSKNAPIQEVFFEDTHENKIERIKKNSFSWFIDDLPKVIQELKHIDTKLICFGVDLSDWQQIDNLVLGEWSESDIIKLSSNLILENFTQAKKNTSGGNGAVYKIDDEEKKSYKLKLYPVDSSHDRLGSEFGSLQVLTASGIDSIPKPFVQDRDLGVGIYEWIEGRLVVDPNAKDLKQFSQFLSRLHAIRHRDECASLLPASASCLSGLEVEIQLRNRISFLENSRQKNGNLDLFLETNFKPILEKLINFSRRNWNSEIGYESLLPRELQTLSPSDFGFHNSIKKPDDSIVFIDFEYFGWDDPAKLIADFILHPGMNLSSDMASYWLEESAKIYGLDVIRRYTVLKPLYGLIWCLILLNDFREEIWTRRVLADQSRESSKQTRLESQLHKAKQLLKNLEEQYL